MTIDSLAITHLLAVAAWLFWTLGPIAFQRRDAIPFGENWRTAKRLSDADLVEKCREREPRFSVHNVHENNY